MDADLKIANNVHVHPSLVQQSQGLSGFRTTRVVVETHEHCKASPLIKACVEAYASLRTRWMRTTAASPRWRSDSSRTVCSTAAYATDIGGAPGPVSSPTTSSRSNNNSSDFGPPLEKLSCVLWYPSMTKWPPGARALSILGMCFLRTAGGVWNQEHAIRA